MNVIYARLRSISTVLLLLFIGHITLAQAAQLPFRQVLQVANISADNLKKDCPRLVQLLAKPELTTAEFNQWIKSTPKEWAAFIEIPAVKKLNIAWATLGIETENKVEFTHSMYLWYTKSEVSEDKKNKLFSHFPLPNLKNDLNKEYDVYDQKIASWQRLYPEEYERFLNTPELTALNPYYNGYYKLPYIPKFIGQDITDTKPVKQKTGNDEMDEYTYQMKLRNWYFVFKPQEFEKLYGKDYKFPAEFDQKAYREYIIKMVNDTKKGVYPNTQNPH